MEDPNEHQQAKQLWRRYRSEVGSSGPCLDALQLASYSEGRCSEDELHGVEQHLALCSTCRETVMILRDPSLVDAEVPSFVAEQAKSLIADPTPNSGRSRKAKRGLSWDWGLQWAAMAVTCAGICVMGFNLGMAVQQTRMQIDQLVVSEMVFGLGDYAGGLETETRPGLRGRL